MNQWFKTEEFLPMPGSYIEAYWKPQTRDFLKTRIGKNGLIFYRPFSKDRLALNPPILWRFPSNPTEE